MYQQHRTTDRIQDPLLARVSYELEGRHREAAWQRLLIEARADRPATMPVPAVLRRWLGARLPAWTHLRPKPTGSAASVELSRAIPSRQ